MAEAVQFERDRAYRGLVDLILGGALAPAKALSERGLAEVLDIGRTPIREALRDLVRDGVLIRDQLSKGSEPRARIFADTVRAPRARATSGAAGKSA